MTVDQILDQAMQLHQAGNLPQARRAYQEILKQSPNHPDALHLLGLIELQTGSAQAGIDRIRQAISIRPDHAEAHYNLGLALQKNGQLEPAIASFIRVASLRPDAPK